ncbi:MAG: acyl-CoA dehydrogenase family protein, partial [Acidimicrobiales bacterium]
MDWTYTESQLELKARARALAEEIMTFEDQCEAEDGLPDEALDLIHKSTLAAGLNAVNMPSQWGGAGLSVLDQVLVQEELGQLTNALWDAVWRPANA